MPRISSRPKARFPKGVSPNPKGRPKRNEDLRTRLRKLMDEDGWPELERIALYSDSEKTRLVALELIAAYAYGRPTTQVDLRGGPIDIVVDLRPAAVAAAAAGGAGDIFTR